MTHTRYIAIHTGIEAETLPVSSSEQIRKAKAALRAAGFDGAVVYEGHPDNSDSYHAGQMLWADE